MTDERTPSELDDPDGPVADEDGPSAERGPSDTSRRRPSRRPGRRDRGPSLAKLALALAVSVPAATYAANCVINMQARETVIGQCVAEEERLATAVRERNALRIGETDWMVILYGARRRYVAELCRGALDELRWWRWNLSRDIEVDVTRASQRDISRALERAAATCGEQVERLQSALESHVADRADPAIAAQVRQVSRGQAEACAQLREAVDDSRQGFWPSLESRGAQALPAALTEIMPREGEGSGDG